MSDLKDKARAIVEKLRAQRDGETEQSDEAREGSAVAAREIMEAFKSDDPDKLEEALRNFLVLAGQ